MLTILARTLSLLPLGVLYRLASPIHFVVYRLARLRRGVVESNLARSFPDRSDSEIKALGRQVYRNYADVLVEMLHSLRMGGEELLRRVRFAGEDQLEAELEGGRPVLLTLAHQCNLEWMLLAVCLRFDFPVEAVYRPLSDPGMEALMAGAYTRFGGRLIDDRSVIRSITKERTVPRIVTLVSDQAPNVKDETFWTCFLHQETGFFLAPEIIARFTNYPVYFAAMRRVSRGHYSVEFTRLAEPPHKDRDRAIVAAYVHAVEKQILEAPADWLWMHRRWKRQRPMYEQANG